MGVAWECCKPPHLLVCDTPLRFQRGAEPRTLTGERMTSVLRSGSEQRPSQNGLLSSRPTHAGTWLHVLVILSTNSTVPTVDLPPAAPGQLLTHLHPAVTLMQLIWLSGLPATRALARLPHAEAPAAEPGAEPRDEGAEPRDACRVGAPGHSAHTGRDSGSGREASNEDRGARKKRWRTWNTMPALRGPSSVA